MWHDFGAVLPAPGLLVRARRYPHNTPPYWGTFDIPTATLTTHLPDATVLLTPWSYLTAWTPLSGPPPSWPEPSPPDKSWRDPFFTPPQDAARVWLRRFDTDAALIRAQYRHNGHYFIISDTPGWRLAWYQVFKWRPM